MKLAPQLPIIILSLLCISGCVDRAAQTQAKETFKVVSDNSIAVATEPAKNEDVPSTLELTGAVKAPDDVTLSSKIAGRLASVSVKEGDVVQSGQVIARLEGTEAYARLSQAQAGVANAISQLEQAQTDAATGPTRSSIGERAAAARLAGAKQQLAKLKNGSRPEEKKQSQANVARAKSDLDYAEKTLARTDKLVSEGALAQTDLEAAINRRDTALATYNSAVQQDSLVKDPARAEDIAVAEEQVRQLSEDVKTAQANRKNDPLFAEKVGAARANVNSARSQVTLAQQGIRDLTIIAPSSGKIVGAPLRAGAVVAPGVAIARLVNLRDVYFEAEASELTVGKLAPGMAVQIQVKAIGGSYLDGTVKSIDSVASSTGRLFNVRVDFTIVPERVRSGMFATGKVLIETQRGVTTLPTGAIVTSGADTWVFAVVGSKAIKKPVTIKSAVGERTVVTGVSPGDRIVIRGQDTLTDGASVKIAAGTGV